MSLDAYSDIKKKLVKVQESIKGAALKKTTFKTNPPFFLLVVVNLTKDKLYSFNGK